MIWRYRITGVLRAEGSGEPLQGLVVRGFDQDLVFDDPLGEARSDAAGRFAIEFTDEAFRSVVDTHPDVYLRVFDASGRRELLSTRERVRRSAGAEEHFELVIPSERLRA